MTSFALAKLINRKLIKISGPDCYPYLQGLICNDLRYLYEPDRIPKRKHAQVSPSVLGTFMLNAQGRVLCDMILYRTTRTRYQCEFSPPGKATEHDELLIECESSIASGIANTLYGYRVRRKISLELLNDYTVWCLFPNQQIGCKDNKDRPKTSQPDSSCLYLVSNQHVDILNKQKEIMENHMTVVCDPRLSALGLRILSTSGDFDQIKSRLIESGINGGDIREASVKDYTVHRHHLGVGEGLKDHPEGACLPLECNADLLGQVSFDKGCYLGQELTARIHYTGVVRKRLMPIVLDKTTTENDPARTPLIEGSDIIDEKSEKKVGTLRHVVGNSALGLLRKDLLNESTSLIHEGTKTKLTTWQPFWWQINNNQVS